MLERTTMHFQKVLNLAVRLAIQSKQNLVTIEYLMLALLAERNVATVLLTKLNINLDVVRASIMTSHSAETEARTDDISNLLQSNLEPLLSPASHHALLFAYDEAERQGSKAVDEGHLLLGIIRENTDPTSQMLAHSGVYLEQVRNAHKGLCNGDEASFSVS